LSSAGVSSLGVAERKFVVEKMREAKGTATMNGTRMREVGVTGIDGEGELRRGETVKRVRRRARPMASGKARGSSMEREGLAGRKRRKGVRVWKMSARSAQAGSQMELILTDEGKQQRDLRRDKPRRRGPRAHA
jgi:hypothetical protein